MTFGLQTGYDQLFFKRTAHTSSQSASTSQSGEVTITGSEATYTPSAGASNVVYEINFYGERTDYVYTIVGLRLNTTPRGLGLKLIQRMLDQL